ncbi:MAG TPA: hypothetical protein VFW71_05460 [Actinomycetota bacterium]|nr:hypothetical protein [Actinomycetota bacterium]
MARFIVLYTADPATVQQMMTNLTPEQSAAGMALWQQWAASCGPALVDLGSPIGPGNHLEGGSVGSSSSQVCGYSIVEADSLEAATALVDGHPHLRSPGTPGMEVLPYLALPGM